MRPVLCVMWAVEHSSSPLSSSLSLPLPSSLSRLPLPPPSSLSLPRPPPPQEEHYNTLVYQLPLAGLQLSKAFELMENARETLNIQVVLLWNKKTIKGGGGTG